MLARGAVDPVSRARLDNAVGVLKTAIAVPAFVAGALVAIAYGCGRGVESENARLTHIAQGELAKIELPTGIIPIYEEVQASRICKTAVVTRLFATDISVADACSAIHATLAQAGWHFREECRRLTYPASPTPMDPARRPYESRRSMAGWGAVPYQFSVQVDAKPQDAWGHLFMMSMHGEAQAIPLAKTAGKTFFTVKLNYSEDHALIARHCPDNSDKPCCQRTLFSWSFSDGRQYSLSE